MLRKLLVESLSVEGMCQEFYMFGAFNGNVNSCY